METKQFKTTPELEKMVRIGHEMNAGYQKMLRERDRSAQNCKVGKVSNTYAGMPAGQVRAIFKKDFGPVDSVGQRLEQCPGAGLCSPAGRRSRIEWCVCGKVE